MQKRVPKKSWPKLPKLSAVPRVSICTPTYNRRVFIPYIIQCILEQTYPLDRIEWIVVDDGADKVGDVIAAHRGLAESGISVRYVDLHRSGRCPAGHKLTLGQKRNAMHEYVTGDVVVYMDDDDYYPKERVEHAVTVLKAAPTAWCAGSSEMHIYFKRGAGGAPVMYQFGPYGPAHATAATFAFRRELLAHTRYDEKASVAEERQFLRDYTVPFVQLETRKSILVFSHEHNSFDKRALLADVGRTDKIQPSRYTPADFFGGSESLRRFYMEEVDAALATYDAGTVAHKPDVVKQVREIGERREKMKREVERNVELGLLQQQLGGVFNNVLFKKVHELDVRLRGLMEKYARFGGAGLTDIVYPQIPLAPTPAECEYLCGFLERQIKKVEEGLKAQIIANLQKARAGGA